MGRLSVLAGGRVYLDSNVFIYALEGAAPWARIARELFLQMEAHEFAAVSSELSLAECIVGPLRLGQADGVVTYERALTSRPGFSIMPVDRTVIREAARLRSEIPALRLPDAIHAATAKLSGCDFFVTNDKHLGALPSVRVILMSESTLEG
ncbi:MAG: PIN domain-containing protein [Candidatus Hydrogenedentota bacterium]